MSSLFLYGNNRLREAKKKKIKRSPKEIIKWCTRQISEGWTYACASIKLYHLVLIELLLIISRLYNVWNRSLIKSIKCFTKTDVEKVVIQNMIAFYVNLPHRGNKNRTTDLLFISFVVGPTYIVWFEGKAVNLWFNFINGKVLRLVTLPPCEVQVFNSDQGVFDLIYTGSYESFSYSVTRLGKFLQVLGTKLSPKSSPNISVTFGLFPIMSLVCKISVWLLFGQFWGEIRQIFIPSSGHTVLLQDNK